MTSLMSSEDIVGRLTALEALQRDVGDELKEVWKQVKALHEKAHGEPTMAFGLDESFTSDAAMPRNVGQRQFESSMENVLNQIDTINERLQPVVKNYAKTGDITNFKTGVDASLGALFNKVAELEIKMEKFQVSLPPGLLSETAPTTRASVQAEPVQRDADPIVTSVEAVSMD